MFFPKWFGKTCVATVHGLDWQREKWGHGFAARYIRWGERIMVRYADEIIVLSESARVYFEQTYHRRTVVIPNGIERPQPKPAMQIRDRFGLEKDSYLCLVSRLTEEKGVHYLIEAFRQLNTDKKLVICGDASDTDAYVARLRTLAGEQENIVFTGFISGDTLAEIYSNAYLVCLPSDLEGMSLSLLEAMAYGNAVLCSDIPENTAVCGDAAQTFRRGDTGDLRQKLSELLQNPAMVAAYRSRAADAVCRRFSWEKTAEQTLALYRAALTQKKAAPPPRFNSHPEKEPGLSPADAEHEPGKKEKFDGQF